MPGTATENLYPPAFLVEWDDQKMLFDCSEGVRFRLEKAGHPIETIHHIAISHSHADHYVLLPLLLGMKLKEAWTDGRCVNNGVNIYCPDTIVKEFPSLFREHWLYVPQDKLSPPLSFHSMSSEQSISVGSAKLFSRKAYHLNGKLDALVFRMETPSGVFVYSGDTGDCEGVRAACRGADIFVCESSARLNDLNMSIQYGHLNARQAGEIATAGGVKHLILFHYTGLNTDEEMADAVRQTGFFGRVTIGKDFQTFEN